MPRVIVLTDSSSDLTPEVARAYGVELFPLAFEFAGRRLWDHEELSSKEMFAQMSAGAAPPRLILPSPAEYLGLIERLLDEDDHVFVIHSSPRIGRLYGLAVRYTEGR